MAEDVRVQSFAAWSAVKNRVTREVDRRAVVRDLFEMAGPVVEPEDVEKLVAGYEARRMGPRIVFAVQQIGEDVLAWQAERSRASFVPPSADQIREAERRAEEARAAGARASTPAPPAVTRGASNPLLDVDRGPKQVTFGYDRRPKLGSGSGLPEIERDDVGTSEERKRLAARELSSLDAAAGVVLSDIPASVLESLTPQPSGTLSPPRSGSVPPGRSASLPPGRAGSISAGRTASIPPSGHASLPPGRTPSMAPPFDGAQPRPILSSVLPPPPDRSWTAREYTYAAVGVLFVAGALLVGIRPAFLFPAADRPVSGAYSSRHLGVDMSFRPGWKHDETRDATTSTPDGLRRHTSIFYRGKSASKFSTRLVVETFTGRTFSHAEAKQLGATEVVGTATERRCSAIEILGTPATQCRAKDRRDGPTVELVEEYFALGERAVFLRYEFPSEWDATDAKERPEDAPNTYEAMLEVDGIASSLRLRK